MNIKRSNEKGQAILLVVLALGIVMFGAIGLALDISQLFAHQQMAQIAADSAAQAAMLSVFQGVNTVTGNAAKFSTGASFSCDAGHINSTPCQYVLKNGFGNDTTTVSFPTCSGVVTTTCGNTTAVKVDITRAVPNDLIRIVGGSLTTNVVATATAAVLSVVAPVPILILHPTLGGALSGNGSTSIVISGGSSRSIQVNSNATDAISGPKTIDLRLAGPQGTGADLGTFGGPPSAPAGYKPGTGHYRQPASPLPDPLLFVLPPGGAVGDPVLTARTTGATVKSSDSPNYGCTSTCSLYLPGTYAAGITVKNENAIFMPGVYVMQNGKGFTASANGNAQMCVVTAVTTIANWPSPGAGCVIDPNGQTGDGMLIYNQGGGNFTSSANSTPQLKGTPDTIARYSGILFFQDHTSSSQTHSISGGAHLGLIGTIYLTNTVNTPVTGILASGHFQTLDYQGGGGSATSLVGQIIVDSLQMGGSESLVMTLSPTSFLHIQQVALVGGGPR